jgi:hypothetical protein
MLCSRTFFPRLAVEATEKSKGMKLQRKDIVPAVPAGLIATAAMTVVMLMAPLAGLPSINMPRVVGWSIRAPLSTGLVLNFLLGVALALLFGAFYSRRIAVSVWVHGVVFGVALWLLLLSLVGPIIGWGLFASRTSSPSGTLLTSLLGHLVFGWTLGFVYERISLRMQS